MTHLGLLGWLKARRIERRLRRRWKADPSWRRRVQGAVEKAVDEKYNRHD